jgi:hypothetical protein
LKFQKCLVLKNVQIKKCVDSKKFKIVSNLKTVQNSKNCSNFKI